MIQGELDDFRYCFSQLGLGKTGFEDEPQYITLRSLDGVAGRFYQIVLTSFGEEKFWSFTEPEELLKLFKVFIDMADRIDRD